MVTLREVAKKAGVSINTASVVLSGRAADGRIAEKTAHRVEKAARHLGYQYNALAKSLRVGRSNTVGVLCHSFPAQNALTTQAAAKALSDAGFQVATQELAWRPELEPQLIRQLVSQRVDGLLMESNAHPDADVEKYEAHQLLLQLAKRDFPIVRIDGAKGLPIDTVRLDREYGAYMAASHLLELGHRRIAYFVDEKKNVPRVRDRIRGFRRAHREDGVANEPLFIEISTSIVTTNPYAGGYQAMERLLAMRPQVTACVAGNDQIAIGAMCAAHNAGWSVPYDIAIIGFTGLPEAEYCTVPLTTIAFPWEAMAREAVNLLQERIEGLKAAPREIVLAPELIVRRSCGANTDFVPAAASTLQTVGA